MNIPYDHISDAARANWSQEAEAVNQAVGAELDDALVPDPDPVGHAQDDEATE